MDQAKTDAWQEQSQRMWRALERFLDSLKAVGEVADLATPSVSEVDQNLKPKVQLRSSDFRNVTSDDQIALFEAINRFAESLKSMEADKDSSKSGANGGVTPEFIAIAQQFASSIPKTIDRSLIRKMFSPEQLPKRAQILLASLLTTAIGDFEVLFSEVVGFFYRMRPDALKAHDAQVSWSEVDTYGSIDELKAHFVDERISQLMWKSFEEWMKWLETQLKIRYNDVAFEPAVTLEVFQRRHVIVHNGGLVSQQYLSRMAGEPSLPPLGARLPVDSVYLDSALDHLTILGISLVYKVVRKLVSGTEDREGIDREAVGLTFQLLKEEQWVCAERVASIILPDVTWEYGRQAISVNRWIALKKLKGTEAIREEVLKWDISALQDRFKLARGALLNESAAVQLARDLLQRKEIDQSDIDGWPLLDDIRDDINRHGDEAVQITDQVAGQGDSSEPSDSLPAEPS